MIDSISVVDTTVKATAVFSREFPSVVAEAAQEAAVRVTPKLRLLANAPRPVKYPIQWKTERQRRAFFASDGFGKGIPYQRTGTVAQGWRIEADRVDNATVLAISNPVSYAKFVYGTTEDPKAQQPFHVATGWSNANTLVDAAKALMLEDVRGQFLDAVAKLLVVRNA
jgi:hypothetical protein